MGMNFPASPLSGDLYPTPAVAGLPQYQWDGSEWVTATPNTLYVKRSGDVMTGNLGITNASGNPSVTLQGTAAHQTGTVQSTIDGVLSWQINFALPGGNFAVDRYDTSGTWQGSAISIDRAGGMVNLGPNAYTLGPSTTNAQFALIKSGNTSNLITGLVGTTWANAKTRWQILLGNFAPETGGNTGSEFVIAAYSDAGAWIQNVMQIQRQAPGILFNTGWVKIQNTAAPSIIMNKNANPGWSSILGQFNGSLRWQCDMGDGTQETGGNAGSNYVLSRFDDNGTFINSPVTIRRSDGAIGLNANVSLNGTTTTVADANSGIIYFGPTASNRYLQNYTGSWYCAGGNFTLAGGSYHGFQVGGGAWGDASDERIKIIRGEYKHGLAELIQIDTVRYSFKGNHTLRSPEADAQAKVEPLDTEKEYIGIVAQKVETVMPELVSKSAGYIDGKKVDDLRLYDASALTYALINAVKELAALNTALAARVMALETLVT